MSRGEVVLGIDPGLASLGWGVVLREDSALRYLHDGTLHTGPADGSDEERALRLALRVQVLFGAASPSLVAIERWVWYPEAETTAAHTLGLVIGALLAVVARAFVGDGVIDPAEARGALPVALKAHRLLGTFVEELQRRAGLTTTGNA